MKLWMDFKYALRLLKKTPGFSGLCLTVVIFGMAISIFTFTLMYESNFRSPPFPDGDRFAVLKLLPEGSFVQRRPTLNAYSFTLFKEQSTHFEELGIFKTELAVLTDGNSTRQFYAGVMQPNLISMTQKQPILGRGLLASDADPGAEPVVLLGYDVWQNYFVGNPEVVGSQTVINGVPTTIVGVMPKDFQIAVPFELWLPLHVPTASTIEEPNQYRVIGTLKAGSSFTEAETEINAILSKIANQDPEYFENLTAQVQPIGQINSSDPGSKFSMPIVCLLIMLLTAINLSSLLFVRANTRQRELAVRSAIGASKWELHKLILLESFILCFIGSLAAIGLAELALQNLEFDSPINVLGKSWRDFSVHTNGLVVTLFLMLGVWLVSALSTTFRIARQDIIKSLDGSSQRGTSKAANVATKTVIGIEVIVAFLLLTVCGTFIASLSDVYSTDYGAKAKNITKGDIALRGSSYKSQDQRLDYINNFMTEVENLRNIENIAITTAVPGVSGRQQTYSLIDRDLSSNDRLPEQGVVWVSANYFPMMDIDILSGRKFSATDTEHTQPVAIIDELMANRYWPNESAIGKQIQLNPDKQSEILTVVGVNKHVVQGVPVGEIVYAPSLYRPISQATPKDFSFVTKSTTGQELATIEQDIRAASLNIDRNVAITAFYDLSYTQNAELISISSLSKVLIFIAISVLALSMIGIYGIISRSIVLRSGEIGIRRAMGSSVSQIIAIFLKQGGIYIGLGIVIGAGLALISVPLLSNISQNVTDFVPYVFAIVLTFLSALILFASYLPARKVIALEPGDALRHD